MREIRQSGSEGGGGETNRPSLPLFRRACASPLVAEYERSTNCVSGIRGRVSNSIIRL